MDCRQFLDDYSDYLDRRLELRPLSDYREHLRNCPSCASYDRVMQRGLRVVRELPPPEPGPDFTPRLQHRLFHVKDDIAREPSHRPTARTVAGLVAAGLIVVTSVSLLRHASEMPELPPVIVEAPSPATPPPGVFPTSPSSVNLLLVPDPSQSPWLTPASSEFSLFRTPLGAHRPRRAAVGSNSED